MTYEELKATENPVLVFTSQDAALIANDLISYHMGLDMQETIRWAEPVQDGATWYIPDPVSQTDTEEQYTAIMERVMDYENAVVALMTEVGA